MRTRHFANTNTGLRRDRNEDAFLGDDRLGLFLVCDGVGGRARGEVASACGGADNITALFVEFLAS